jgi:hypothetical protein
MKFRVVVTAGGEVTFAGQSQTEQPVYYGAPVETGLWRISIPRFEDHLTSALAQHAFGDSIEEFIFGLEIGELDEWGQWFKATHDYVSYRPKSKTLVSVGQIEWKQVKDLPPHAQLVHLSDTLISSIERLALLKRKPKDFDQSAFAASVRQSLGNCTLATVIDDDV